MSTAPTALEPNTLRRERILSELKLIVNELTGVDLAEIDQQATFFEMGVDSLLMIQANLSIKERLGVEISLVQLFEELSCIGALVDYLDETMPQTPAEAPAAEGFDADATPEAETDELKEAETRPTTPRLARLGEPIASGAPLGEVRNIIAQQLQLMSQQLEVLRATRRVQARPAAPIAPTVEEEAAPEAATRVSPSATEVSKGVGAAEVKKEGGSKLGLTPRQQEHLDALIERYTARTPGSKRLAQAYRPYWADNRASAGFRLLWKELVYPVVAERSAGAHVWDVDGNEYLDVTMGFGVSLFGHAPSFVKEALTRQLDEGIHLGPQSRLAGHVAELICELTGVERVTFCNSGTEAVMAAIRLARTRTRRNKLALFSGSYHGTFDETLVRGINLDGTRRTIPAAPGVAPHMAQDVLVLEYNDPESLNIIREHAHELAAVLVEPVQSRSPDVQPRDFLRRLRRLTEETGVALIFDEVITGFRVHPGGCQHWFGIEADLVTYGKVVGGGMPIGVVAGKAAYIDAIDGGFWEYGDNSHPRAEKTIFTGTFCKHPLAMAAAAAVLEEMKARGPELQAGLNRRTAELAATLNAHFERDGLPLSVPHFGSLFQFSFKRGVKFAELFPFYLTEQGVYVWEGPTRFLSAAHTDEDIELLVRATTRALARMREADFLPADSETPSRSRASNTTVEAETPSDDERAATSLPLTEAQRQLWVLAQMGDDASRAFNESVTLRMRGALDAAALRDALQKIVERHEALRTSFDPEGERQSVQACVTLDVPFTDFSGLGAEARADAVKSWMAEAAERPFDLARAPLMRARVARVEEGLHLLVLTVHHIVIDGQSYGVLLEELRELYAAECRGTAARLPRPTSFGSYLEWHAERRGRHSEAATDYWAAQFADAVPVVELPTARPRPPVRTFAGARESLLLDAAVGGGLQQLGARTGATLFMTLLAAFNVLLHRLSGQEDVLVAVPAAGQAAMGSKSLVGFGVVQLPLRSTVKGDETFADYLRSVRKRVLEAHGHTDYSPAELTRKLGLAPDPSRIPLMSVSFNLDRAGVTRFHDIEVEVETNATGATKFDLYLNVTETAGVLRLDCDYNSDLYDADAVRRWLAHYRTLLEALPANAERPLASLPLLSAEERRRLLVEWNETAAEYPSGACVQELFEAQAAQTPEAVAVEFEGRALTYGELNRRANQLAHHLRALGVGPDVLVGLCVERSLEMMVGLLGVLKAGGAYVPLDPAYPVERLAFMLEDAGASVLLTQAGLRDALPPYAGPVIHLDSDWPLVAAEAEENSSVLTTSDNLAYVIYTSGSTGRPKGTMIHHRGLVNYLFWCVRAYAVAEGQGSLVHSSFSFDLTVTSIYPPLLTGRRVELLGPAGGLDALTEALRRTRDLSLLKLTPAHLKLLADQLSTSEARGRAGALVVGGENLLAEVASYWRRAAPLTRIVNEYGPTETVVGCCVYEVREETPHHGSIPIGRPIANTRLFVLDKRLEPVPVGVAGELYVGGAGVARGYLNRPDLTAERFVPDAWGGEPGSRLYRTGDLVRHMPNGELEYLGRIDHQVKVRGFRVEPGEVEAALAAHPLVREAVVVVREDAAGEGRLVAYVTTDATSDAASGREGEAAQLAVADLRKFVKQSLPGYMVPSSFVVLEEMPLNANGKVDRGELPAPDASRRELDEEFVAPRTAAEELMADIWRQVLGVERVGVHDNFFDLGGDSIINIQIASRAAQAGLRVTPRQVFQHQTIAELVASAGTGEAVQAEQGLVTGDVPLTPIQRWFFEREPVDPHHFNQAVLLEVREAVEPEVLRQAVEHLVRHHDLLRARFRRTGAGWRQFIAEAEEGEPFVRVDLTAASDAEVAPAVEEAATRFQSGFNLAEGPLVRVALFDLGGTRPARLLVVAHHLVMDGVSWRILLDDLQLVYRQLRAGEGPRLLSKTTSYKHWAERLAEHARAEETTGESGFWARAAGHQTAPLPLDFEGGVNDVGSSRQVSATLEEGETLALLQDVPPAYHTQINDLLLSALLQVLTRWTGERGALIDLEGHGREDIFEDVDLSRTVGWFTTIFPVRLELPDSPSDGETIKAVKEQLQAIPRRGLGYGLLRYLGEGDAGVVRGLSAELSFNYLGQLDRVLSEGSPFAHAAEPVGATVSPRALRPYLLEVNALVSGGRLRVNWTYSENVHRRATVERLAGEYLDALRSLISHCLSPEAGDYTAADFTPFEWDQEDMNSITAAISNSARKTRP